MQRRMGARWKLASLLVLPAALECTVSPPHDRPPTVAPPAGVESPAIRGTRTAWVGSLSTGCAAADLELVIPFYEGIRMKPAAARLSAAQSEHLELAYPGPLSMPLVAWRCGAGTWTAVTPDVLGEIPVGLLLRTTGSDVEARLECFGTCTFREIHARGDWSAMAKAVAEAWHVAPPNPPLAKAYRRFHFFVRQWVANDAPPALRSDWNAAALLERIRAEDARTISFVFGLDPNEVDLEGHYFWSDGAMAEAKALVAANRKVAQFHWLNLRSYKYAIPKLGIERTVPPEVRGAAKLYANGPNDFSQYVFTALEMCLGASAWQKSRLAELEKLVALGFRLIAFDEFPTSPKWGTDACRATNHLHRPNDFADEWRVSLDLVRRLSAYARGHGVLVSSEEPSTLLLPFTSGYMDGTFNDPPDMYEHWLKSAGTERITLFSTMFGDQITPYTRTNGSPKPPKGWLVQEKIPGPS
jgi:hypothetical protein